MKLARYFPKFSQKKKISAESSKEGIVQINPRLIHRLSGTGALKFYVSSPIRLTLIVFHFKLGTAQIGLVSM